jgi:hypothetical protein
MRTIGRINNVLYHYIDGARIIITSYVSSDDLDDIIDYGDVKAYSSMYFIEMALFGESQYAPTKAITPDDMLIGL